MNLAYLLCLACCAVIFILGLIIGTFVERSNWNELIHQGLLPTPEYWKEVQTRIARMAAQLEARGYK